MGFKLVALDIDGTIRTADRPLSDRTRQAIARVGSCGVTVTLATGRMFRSALRACAELKLKAPIASFQGAHLADPNTEEVLWHKPLTPQMGRAALEALASRNCQVMGYHGHEVYVSELSRWVESYGERGDVKVNVVGDLSDIADLGLTRLVVVDEPDEVRRLETHLKARFDSRLHITRSLPHFCEILHPEGGKHSALSWLCSYLGIDQRETIAFGNGPNDVDMLKWAGMGVAIAGAAAEALEVADRVAPPVEEDGAAQMLEDLMDRGLLG